MKEPKKAEPSVKTPEHWRVVRISVPTTKGVRVAAGWEDGEKGYDRAKVELDSVIAAHMATYEEAADDAHLLELKDALEAEQARIRAKRGSIGERAKDLRDAKLSVSDAYRVEELGRG